MLPFTIHEFKLFAPITLNGQTAMAYLDTGASGHSISLNSAAGLEPLEKDTVQFAFGQQERETVRVANLDFLGEKFYDIRAGVDDSPGTYEGVPFPVSMTLGVPILLARPLVLDFKRLQIGFVTQPLSPDLHFLPTDLEKGIPITTLQLGDCDIRTIFDTGAGLSLLNSARIAGLGLQVEKAYSLEVFDPAGAKANLDVYRHSQLRADQILFGECEFLALDLTPLETKAGLRVDFVLGANTLLRSGAVWVLDMPLGRIGLTTTSIDVV